MMRLRRHDLRTGSLLALFDRVERTQNRSLLFLVEGAGDVEPLARAEAACRRLLEKRNLGDLAAWYAVADQGALTDIDPCLNPTQVFAIEAAELSGLREDELQRLFAPVMERLVAGAGELFPVVGGALGNTAEGLQLLGRETFLNQLREHLGRGEDLYLTAPRRSGKTSVLLRLEATASALRTVFVDLERARDERHAVALLRARLLNEGPRAALAAIGEDWAESLRHCLTSLAESGGRPACLLLDEMVFFLASLKDGDEKRWRERVRAFLEAVATAVAESGSQLVVSGSADLFDFLRDTGIRHEELPSPIQRLQRLRLPLLGADRVDLRCLLLGAGLVLEPEELRWLEENLDLSLPYPAQLFLDHLVAKARGNRTPQGTQALESLLQAFLSQTSAFHDVQERLNRRSVERAGLREVMNALLDRLAQGPLAEGELVASLPDSTDRSWFLETYPVIVEDHSARLASKLFRRWWSLSGGV